MNLTLFFSANSRYISREREKEIRVSLNSGDVSPKQLEGDLAGFRKLSEYLRREAGINLTLSAKNQTLLASRIGKIMNPLGFSTYSELHSALLAGRRDVRDLFINAITTNTTHFFREKQHFDFLAKAIRDVVNHPDKKKSREIRVWCAACSTGEEAYSLTMSLSAIFPANEGWHLKILATDIDTDVLKKAARGVYPQEAIESVPDNLKNSCFDRGVGDSDGLVRVRKSLRDLITFAPFNLMSTSYAFQSKFDVIFCRNVMIYFDRPEIQSTIRKLEGCLRLGGLLFLGHSETIIGVTPGLKSRAPSVYERLNTNRKGEAA
jgi:chemotaxis protein methyltransferase CheR